MHDDSRIEVDDGEDLRRWMRALAVDEQALRNAIKTVGPEAERVRRHLGRHPARGGPVRGGPGES